MATTVLKWKGKTIHGWLLTAGDFLARAEYAAGNGAYGPYVDRMCDEAIKALRAAKRTNTAPKGQEEDFRAGRMSSGGKRRHAKHAGKLVKGKSRLGSLADHVNRLVRS